MVSDAMDDLIVEHVGGLGCERAGDALPEAKVLHCHFREGELDVHAVRWVHHGMAYYQIRVGSRRTRACRGSILSVSAMDYFAPEDTTDY